MIPILSPEQVRKVDRYTIENEPITSIDLMERASGAFVDWFKDNFSTDQSVFIICGTGNNGGDGLAIARMLKRLNFYTKAWVVGDPDKGSPDFKTNLDRWKKLSLIENTYPNLLPGEYDVIIDAIFGSGLSRCVEGEYVNVIERINGSKAVVISVDIASGLFADKPSDGTSVFPDFTTSFQIPKLNFFLPENQERVGEWVLLDIGIDEEFLASQPTYYHLVTTDYIKSILKKRSKFSHKGTYGRALIMAGSYGKMGACILASRAALRSGVGLITAHVPGCGHTILQTALPEAMTSIDKNDHFITQIPELFPYSSIGIGPGLGVENESSTCLMELLKEVQVPVVLDADALNIISDNRDALGVLPHKTILTPHPKEFERLVGNWSNDVERLEMQREFSKKHKVIVALKGAHTSISDIEGNVYFNSTGNPGMATAGSGDVLTGVITALLSQGYSPFEAAVMGVYIHGMAGDIAAGLQGIEGLIASDIIDNLPQTFMKLNEW